MQLLFATAVTIGTVHTLLGPDHYVPFVAMARARNWSRRKTMLVTFLSGLGHVSGSVLVGILGLFFGAELLRLTALESMRGSLAGWMLFGFGLAYTVWGIRRAVRHAPVTHSHGSVTHLHFGPREHEHDPVRAGITPWILFTIFVFGPCEPLIPLIMYSAAQSGAAGTAAVVFGFGIACVGTMMVLVYAGLRGIEGVFGTHAERFSHALAGAAVLACGAGVVFLNI